MDALLIIIVIAMSLLMLGLSFYLLVVYVHPDDKGWGTAWYSKILVIAGMMLVWAQALMLPLDVSNNQLYPNSGGINMQVFWAVVYMVTLAMVTLLLPYAMIFYETDPEHGTCKRLLTALCYLAIALVVVCILLFVSWAFLKYADIPVTMVAVAYDANSLSSSSSIISQTAPETSTTMKVQASFVVYCMAIMSFFGWILLILFGGVGIFALPLDWIYDFRHRPKPRRSDEMTRTKETLATTVEEMKKVCTELRTEEETVRKSESGFFNRLKEKRHFTGRLSQLRAEYSALEGEYELFRLQLKYQKTNPLVPWLKLVCAVLFLLTAVLWVLHLIFGYLARSSDRPLIPFLNELFVYMQSHNAGFVATFLYSYFILYLVWAVVKGNAKFGIRIPMVIRFYPMKPNETWMNSFLFNIIMLLIASTGITQLATGCFPTYTRNTAIYNMYGLQVNYMRFYRYLYQYKVFGIAFVVWAGITLIYLLVTCNRKPKYLRERQAIQKEHVGKLDIDRAETKTNSKNDLQSSD